MSAPPPHRRPPPVARAALATALALTLAVVALTWAVEAGATAGLDGWADGRARAVASPALTDAMEAVSLAGSGWVIGPLAGVVTLLLLRARARRAALLFALAMLGAYLAPVLKEVFDRPRPVPVPGYDQPTTFAYPSGHAMTSASFAAALVLAWPGRRRPVAAVAAAFVVAVGASRVLLGAHWPTDVIGGWLIAAAWAALVAALLLPRRERGADQQ